MCGRYYSLFDKQQIAEHFHVRSTADNVGIIAPNWNAAPGDPQHVIRRSHDTGERELVMMRWGIVPWFAKSEDEFKALSTINAKSGDPKHKQAGDCLLANCIVDVTRAIIRAPRDEYNGGTRCRRERR
jgi:putative SOS response-associated peptidase YedK